MKVTKKEIIRPVLNIAALALMREIAKKLSVNIPTAYIRIHVLKELEAKYNANGIFNAMEAAAMFLLPLTPLTLLISNPSGL